MKARQGEAKLSKESVVNISQLITVDKADLFEKIGTLSGPKIKEVIEGIRLTLDPRDL